MTFYEVSVIIGALLLTPFVASGAEVLRLRHIGSLYADGKGVGLSRPEGVACNDTATFVVADTGNGRLLRATIQDGAVKGGDSLTVTELSSPLATQLNARGETFVLDGRQRKIARIGSDGAFKGFIAPSGIPAPQEYSAKGLKLAGEELYILDIYGARVLVVDAEGKYVRHLSFPEDYSFISDLAVDAKGTVYLLDSVKKIIYSAVKDAKGFALFSVNLAEYLNFPANMTIDAKGVLYLTDQDGSTIATIGRDGAFQGRALGLGWKEGLLNHPAQICINEKNEVFIADSANNRVQVYTILE